jgi:plastocyanin
MRFPRILFALPLIVAGMVLPAAGAELAKPPPHALGMSHEGFVPKTIEVRQGDTLTLVNNSRWIHIVGPGREGRLSPDKGVPAVRRTLMQTNDVYTTGKWTTPGTYFMTCPVHPEMTVKVIIKGCACCATGSCA